MKKMVFFYVLILVLNINITVNAAECEIVIDADSKRVLYGKNINQENLIASTTKVLTALVVLNNARLKDVVEVDENILDAYGSSIYIKPKEKMTVEDLLYGLLLRSGNDAAIALAIHTAGSIEAFASLMNDTAKAIGMKNSIFGNPHGLDDEPINKSTVYDMALLMIEAMKNPEFKKITSSIKYTTKSNFNNYEWYNKNELLTSYKYATGGKTGYTTKARHTFISSATKDNKNLVIVTFVDPNRFITHKALYEKYFELYKKYLLIDKNNLNINYKKGYKIFTLEDFYMLLDKEETSRVNREIVLYKDVDINSGTIIGNISITLDGKTYKKLNIYATKLKNKKRLFERVKEFLSW